MRGRRCNDNTIGWKGRGKRGRKGEKASKKGNEIGEEMGRSGR